MNIDPATGLRSFASRDEYRAAVGSAQDPTTDDCTVLCDGTRIDTAEKARTYMADMARVLAAGHARDVVAP